jgi:hypothetical protein
MTKSIKLRGFGNKPQEVSVGSIVAFNTLEDAAWFDVIAIDGQMLTIREHGTDYRPERMDKSLVKQVRQPEARKVAGIIDCTPTWAGILPMLLAGLEGSPTGRRMALEELTRMARLADLYVKSQKAAEDKAND